MNRNAKIALVCALLTAATAAVYAETASFDFVALDDPLHVTRNPMVRAGLSADGVRWAFTETHAGYWIPLTWISHMIDCEIHGLSPAGPHLANLALHIVNALLVFLVLLRATGRLVPSAFAAALFALHPLRVESVAWVTERKDVLSTAFGLASTLAYLAFAVRGGALRYGAVALLFAASLMAKPMLVTLPLVFLLLDAWPLDRLGRRQLLEKLPLLAISLVFSIVAVVANSAHGALPGTDAIPVHLRLANAAVSCVRYLGATFWPADLAAFYPHPYLPDGTPWSPAQVLGSLGLLLGISGALVWRAALDRAALVGWLWFLGTLVPVLGLVQAGEQAMAEWCHGESCSPSPWAPSP